MIDITDKKPMHRMAKAVGEIVLKKDTIYHLVNKDVKKGDCLETAKIAGLNAVKQTPLLIPYCHQIPIESVDFYFETKEDRIIVQCTVRSFSKTGVEMEALLGVTIALNTIWDMIKYLEKDDDGQYPTTCIRDIRIIEKVKQDE